MLLELGGEEVAQGAVEALGGMEAGDGVEDLLVGCQCHSLIGAIPPI